jgi:hypothetical protein
VKGTLAPTASIVTAVSHNFEIPHLLLGAPLRCEQVVLSIVITKNNGSEVEASADPAEGSNSTNDCLFNAGPATIDEPTLGHLTATPKATTADLSLTVTVIKNTVTCEFEGNALPLAYSGESHVIQIAGRLKDPHRAACLEPEFHGEFELTISGTAVILD